MELAWKTAAVGITAALVSLLIKRTNPELSAALSLLTIATLAFAALTAVGGIKDLVDEIGRLSGGAGVYIAPVVKCAAIGVVTKLAAELCREASQCAIASGVELAGTMCALGTALPLILSALRMIGELV